MPFLTPSHPPRASVSVVTDPAAPGYTFTAGDRDDAVVPERVILVGRGQRPPFVNTTVRALNAFDYLFDAEAGAVGFRPLKGR